MSGRGSGPGPEVGGTLHSAVQCIKGNGHMEQTDKRKHYLPITSLAGGNYGF